MKTIIDLFHDRLQAQPEKVVYQFWQNGAITDKLTFSDLGRRVRAVAAHLQTVAPAGERVLLLFPQSLDPIVAFYACLLNGMAAVPLPVPDPGPVENRLVILRRYLENARSQTILTTRAVAAGLKPGAEQAGMGYVHWIELDGIELSEGEGWQAPEIPPETPGLMMYTSGSTQQPRGVLANHANLSAALFAKTHRYQELRDIGMASWSPLYTGMGLSLITYVLTSDLHQIILSPQAFIQKPVSWLKVISEYHLKLAIAPTFAYRLCVEGIKPEEREGLDLRSWIHAGYGGESVRYTVLEQFAKTYQPYGFSDKAYYAVYAMSESVGIGTGSATQGGIKVLWVEAKALEQRRVVAAASGSPDARPFVGCGKTVPGHRLVLVDPDTLQECAPDRVGEIWMSGPGIAQGYWNNPKATAEVFGAHLANGEGPFLRTGDLGFLKEDELYVVGRIKDVIIVNGRNYSAIDFELAAAGAHPALQPGMAAAFGVTVDGEEKVVLMHEIRPGQEQVDVDEIAGKVRQAVSGKIGLPLYAVLLIKAGSLPRTGSGKIQRYLCRSRYLESQSDLTERKQAN